MTTPRVRSGFPAPQTILVAATGVAARPRHRRRGSPTTASKAIHVSAREPRIAPGQPTLVARRLQVRFTCATRYLRDLLG
jgi:hypothetical protein